MASAIKIAVYWGDVLYDTVLCAPKERVTVGKGAGNTVVLDLGKASSVEKLELVHFKDKKSAVLAFDQGVDGLVRYQSGPVPLSNVITEKKVPQSQDGLYRLDIGENDKAELVIGHVTFFVDWIPKRRLIKRRSMVNLRNAVTIALYLAILVPLTMFVEGLKPEEMKVERPERLMNLIPREKPKPTPKPKAAEAAAGQKKTADGGAQKGDPGKATLKPPTAAEKLRSANLSSLASSLTSLTANAGPKVDMKPNEAYAPIAQAGTGGFTTDGIKQGGGGKGIGIGRTVGQGEGGFGGTGKLGLSGSSIGSANTGRGKPGNDAGGLDKDVIDTIVRQRKDRIRLCYERQLNFKPTLGGKVTVQFVIGKDGRVLASEIAEDTMKDDAVRKCLMAEVKSWTFPKPQGGAVVSVDYPFVFESGNR